MDPFTTLWDGLKGNVAQESIDEDLSGLANETITRSSIYAQVSDSLSGIPALARLAQEVDHPRNIEDLRLLLGDPDGETSRAFWFLLTTGILELTDEAPSSRQRGGVGHGASASSASASKAAPVAERMRAPAAGMEHQVQFELKSSKQDAAREQSERSAPARDPVGTVRLDYINKMTSDHYGFLEIDRAALGTDIDSAYQTLAPRYRRQSLPDDVDAETKRMAKELLARLVSVYEELSDPARRARYDLLGPERHQTKTTAEGPEKAASDDVPTADDIPADAGEGQTQQPEEPDATASGAGKRPAPATTQDKDWADELRWYPGCEDPTQVRQRSAQLDPEDASLLLQAHELMGQQKFKKAFGLLDGLRERDPSNSGLLADLGWCRFAQDTENERNVTKALEWVDLALAFDPGYRDALEAKARILCRCGADQQVIPVLQSLVGVDPDLKWAEDELALRKEAKEAEEAAQQKGGLRSLLGRKG
ncbi:MAG TPA: hypothetical protein DIU15_04460 [Deltaproteobacteria bacterium]|nr:hypothetical protein [Deltaproteobacteria bacterium]